jgi:hypothetical protein
MAYCNAPLHWECYARWPERPRFARQYVKAWVDANRRNPFWWRVYLDDAVYVSVNPQPPVDEVSVRLQAVGSDIRVPLRRWKDWLREPMAVTPTMRTLELEALTVALPKLAALFPNDYALIDAINPDEKLPRRRRAHAPERG